ASATDSNATALLLCAIMTAATAAFLDQPDALDAHAAFDRLHHVIDGQAGDGDGGEGFHLDAGLSRDFDPRPDLNAGQLGVRPDIDFDLRDGKRVTERDQFVRALGRHDAGDARGAEHIALFGVAALHDIERGGRHHHAPLGARFAFRGGLRRNVDHPGLAAGAEMREIFAPCHNIHRAGTSTAPRARSARVAAATSFWRIKLSPTRNVAIPALASLARSSGANIPLSATTTRPPGTEPIKRSLIASVVSKVFRLRLLMPTSRDLRCSARVSSCSSWISTSTSMPSANAAASS